MAKFSSLDQVILHHWTSGNKDFADCLNAAMTIVRAKGTVTSDDIRAVLNLPPDCRVVGSALMYLLKAGHLKIVDRVPSKIKTSHGRRISVYAAS